MACNRSVDLTCSYYKPASSIHTFARIHFHINIKKKTGTQPEWTYKSLSIKINNNTFTAAAEKRPKLLQFTAHRDIGMCITRGGPIHVHTARRTKSMGVPPRPSR